MKNIGILLLSFFVLTIIISSCHKEESKKISLYCDYPTGNTPKSQVGRIYKMPDSSSNNFLYYIGNPDPSLKGSGFVPCNGIPEDLKPASEIGVLVIYSGVVKLGRDAEEPLYFGIELTEIKKAD